VLIVDDDFDIRDTLADILADEGYTTAAAADGIEALAWLRANPRPCLILLDWMMPRCDGASFRMEQRKDTRLADIPVALLTADARVEEKSASVDAVAYLKKPVTLGEILAVLHKFCA
jgi:CheY-like chemotaxis protein